MPTNAGLKRRQQRQQQRLPLDFEMQATKINTIYVNGFRMMTFYFFGFSQIEKEQIKNEKNKRNST